MNTEQGFDIDWAYIIDLLASEYGWTIEYIQTLNLGQIHCLCQAIKIRYANQNGNSEDLPQEVGSGGREELKLTDFETKMGGKKVVHEDGTVEIIV